jgi:hypothetical protein
MGRQTYFKLRLDDAERRDLEERAEQEGRTKADVIRSAMGWKPERKSRRVGHMARQIAKGGAAEGQADPETEPGKAAIERLAKQIRNREGVTTPVARREARERLMKGNVDAREDQQ